MKRTLFASAALCLAAALPVSAAGLDKRPVTGAVVEGWTQADGTVVAGLKLTLAPGWKTYWRAPGDAGIPPQFDWSGSDNLAQISVTWPTPVVFDQAGMRSIGYKDEVIIPLHVTPRAEGPVQLRATMELGVCSDICLPETLEFDATLETTSTRRVPAIAAALAARPYTASEAGVRAATCTLKPTAQGLEITARLTLPDTGGSEVVVIEPGQSGVWVSEADTSRSGDVLTAQADMAAGGAALALDRSAIRFTVLGGNMAVDIKGCTAG